MHFLIATILHATGRGEIVEKIQRDYDETGTRQRREHRHRQSPFDHYPHFK